MEGLSVVFDPDLIQFVEFNLPDMIIDSMAYDKDQIKQLLQFAVI